MIILCVELASKVIMVKVLPVKTLMSLVNGLKIVLAIELEIAPVVRYWSRKEVAALKWHVLRVDISFAGFVGLLVRVIFILFKEGEKEQAICVFYLMRWFIIKEIMKVCGLSGCL